MGSEAVDSLLSSFMCVSSSCVLFSIVLPRAVVVVVVAAVIVSADREEETERQRRPATKREKQVRQTTQQQGGNKDTRTNEKEGEASLVAFSSFVCLLRSLSDSHPLDRSDSAVDGDSSSGPVRNQRRNDRSSGSRRSDVPYSRGVDRSSSGGSWVRDGGVASASYELPASAPPAQIVTQQFGAVTSSMLGDTVRLANLDSNITEDDLRAVFGKIGSIRSVQINYTAQGQCIGTAEVQFANPGSAQHAVSVLDQAEVDGRIMYVQLVGNLGFAPSRAPQVRRRDDRRGDERRGDDRRGGDRRDDDRRGGERRDDRRGGERRQGGRDGRQGGGERRTGGAGGKGGRGGRQERAEVKPEDLDAEMDAYRSATSAAPAAAAAAAPAAESSAPAAME